MHTYHFLRNIRTSQSQIWCGGGTCAKLMNRHPITVDISIVKNRLHYRSSLFVTEIFIVLITLSMIIVVFITTLHCDRFPAFNTTVTTIITIFYRHLFVITTISTTYFCHHHFHHHHYNLNVIPHWFRKGEVKAGCILNTDLTTEFEKPVKKAPESTPLTLNKPFKNVAKPGQWDQSYSYPFPSFFCSLLLPSSSDLDPSFLFHSFSLLHTRVDTHAVSLQLPILSSEGGGSVCPAAFQRKDNRWETQRAAFRVGRDPVRHKHGVPGDFSLSPL